MGYAEILSMQDDPHVYPAINSSRERSTMPPAAMLHLVTDMLDINAIEEGSMGLKQEEANLGNVIAVMIAANQLAAERKHIAIRYPSNRPVFVTADAQAMSQIAENLISNAIKDSPLASCVTVKLIVHEGTVTMEVHDEGPGLSEEDQSNFSRNSPASPDSPATNRQTASASPS